MSEEPRMINTTLDNGRCLRQLIIGVSLFFAFQAIRKIYKYINFRLATNQDLFHAHSSIRNGDYGICWIKWRTDARTKLTSKNLAYDLIKETCNNLSYYLPTRFYRK